MCRTLNFFHIHGIWISLGIYLMASKQAVFIGSELEVGEVGKCKDLSDWQGTDCHGQTNVSENLRFSSKVCGVLLISGTEDLSTDWRRKKTMNWQQTIRHPCFIDAWGQWRLFCLVPRDTRATMAHLMEIFNAVCKITAHSALHHAADQAV